MQLLVEIEKAEVQEINGVSAKTGKPYSIRKQPAYIQLAGEKYPQKFNVPLFDNAQPYPAGKYHLDLSDCLYINNFGDMSLSKSINLKPAVQAAKTA